MNDSCAHVPGQRLRLGTAGTACFVGARPRASERRQVRRKTPRTTACPEGNVVTIPPSLLHGHTPCQSQVRAALRAQAPAPGGGGTSGITYWPAMSRAPSRFSRPSLHRAWMGTWGGARTDLRPRLGTGRRGRRLRLGERGLQALPFPSAVPTSPRTGRFTPGFLPPTGTSPLPSPAPVRRAPRSLLPQAGPGPDTDALGAGDPAGAGCLAQQPPLQPQEGLASGPGPRSPGRP